MTGDLFGFLTEVGEESFSSRYCSGASNYWDAKGLAKAVSITMAA